MNIASWIILAVVIVWIGFAVRSAFFGGSKKHSCHGGESSQAPSFSRSDSATLLSAGELDDDDEKYRLPSACAGCSKGSCSGCSNANRDIPMPIIRELR